MGRLHFLGGQSKLLSGQMPTQLTCYLPPCKHLLFLYRLWQISPDHNPSTGLILVTLAFTFCDEITLFGFYPFKNWLQQQTVKIPLLRQFLRLIETCVCNVESCNVRGISYISAAPQTRICKADGRQVLLKEIKLKSGPKPHTMLCYMDCIECICITTSLMWLLEHISCLVVLQRGCLDKSGK